ncbi:MAG: hypothetical protein LBM03_00985 [Erysipelotrichaceae bacterium]|jgi:hypothetical protein|nr:hypothetical protein [Erysipelotrichaceae bacterium]
MTKIKKLSGIILGGLLAIGIGANGAKLNVDEKASAATGDYNIVSDMSTLAVGDQIIIAYTAGGFALGGQVSTNYRGNVATTISGGVILAANVNATTVLTLGGQAGAWTLTDSEGSLLQLKSSANSLQNAGSASSANAQWTITGNDSAAHIVNNEYNTRRIQYNTGSPRFACYTGTQKDPQIYKLETGGPAVTLESISVGAMPNKVEYIAGEIFDTTGLRIDAHYSNTSIVEGVTGYETAPAHGDILTKVGIDEVAVLYADNGVEQLTSFEITVTAPVPMMELDQSELEIENAKSKDITASVINFSATPTITAAFASTGTAVGTYATASVSALVITVNATAVGSDTLTITATNGAEVVSHNVSITVKPEVLGQWVRVTSQAELTDGQYIITAPGSVGGEEYAINSSSSTSTAPVAVSLTWDEGVPSKEVYNPMEKIGTTVIWDFVMNSSTNASIKSNNNPAVVSQYLYVSSASNGNYLRVGGTEDTWNVVFTDSYFTLQDTLRSKFVEIFNKQDFRTYASTTTGGQIGSNADCFKMQLYKWSSGVTLTDTLTIGGELTNQNQYAGNTLDITGLTVTANYSNLSTMAIDHSLLTLPIVEMDKLSYEISYTEGGVTATATVAITSTLENAVTSLSWTNRKVSFNEGQNLLANGGQTVESVHADGSKTPLNFAEDVTIYVYTGEWNVANAEIITTTTTLTHLGYDGMSIRLGITVNDTLLLTTSGTLSITFVWTTTISGESAGGTATLVTNVSDLALGDQLIVTGYHNESMKETSLIYAMSTVQNSNNRGATTISVTDNTIDLDTVNPDIQIVTLATSFVEGDNKYSLSVGTAEAPGYLTSVGSSSNYLHTDTSNLTSASSFTISIAASGAATVQDNSSNTRDTLKVNSGGINILFSCYGVDTTGNGISSVYLYKVSGTVRTAVGEYLVNIFGGIDPATSKSPWCALRNDLEALNLIYDRYNMLTESEKTYFNHLDFNGTTGATAFSEAMADRARLLAAAAANDNNIIIADEGTMIALIVSVAVLSVSLIAAFFYFKKRKEA